VGLVVADDAHDGWTNRYASEFSHRFEERDASEMIVGLLWTSEAPARHGSRGNPDVDHRAAYIRQHGAATSLAGMLAQEGRVMAMQDVSNRRRSGRSRLPLAT
jgi:hypothetical protein